MFLLCKRECKKKKNNNNNKQGNHDFVVYFIKKSYFHGIIFFQLFYTMETCFCYIKEMKKITQQK